MVKDGTNAAQATASAATPPVPATAEAEAPATGVEAVPMDTEKSKKLRNSDSLQELWPI